MYYRLHDSDNLILLFSCKWYRQFYQWKHDLYIVSIIFLMWLDHLGWLYVFSSFPLHPLPLPQQLLPLRSKPFQLNLRYLAQSIYWSEEMYWITFSWPWPKVTAVASISKNLLVWVIKWEPLIGSVTTKHVSFIDLVMVITWLDFGEDCWKLLF